MLLVAALTAGVSAMAPVPVPWSYRAMRGMCELEEGAALDGVHAAYPIGQRVRTKFGWWVCVEVIAQQAQAAKGGAWIADKAP